MGNQQFQSVGPAEVPMMSPNGSIPPIHVPPGYISQVLEDTTGVRRVVVTPQSPECYPPSYSPALSPTHHLPPYLAHPHFIPNSHSFYPPVSPGELPPHQYYQHLPPHMYSDQEIIPVYGMSNFIGREDTYSKPQPKKTKEPRQPDRQNRLNSPPSTLYKGGMGTAYNGYSNKSHAPSLGSVGSGGGVGSPGGKKVERRLRSSPRNGEPETQSQGGGVGSPGGKKVERRLRSSPRNGEPETQSQVPVKQQAGIGERCVHLPEKSVLRAIFPPNRAASLSRNRWFSSPPFLRLGSASPPPHILSPARRELGVQQEHVERRSRLPCLRFYVTADVVQFCSA
ncbi:Fibronectin type III domain-containing protein 3B [Takifugu flavidus]|uniref:Fibronectin type III domain-containing protein 3B n=1 Tax=Takifugu flavidus TaxID=433684 RepID=A0A5C6NYA1_9TELE|nr:Fibronectin type III domain-containing protein 3B [Takifugu flavidus]